MTLSLNEPEISSDPGQSGWRLVGVHLLETGLLVLLFFCFSPGVPGVNEPHYLCKAKHFWDPTFCPGDLFLESADAHYLFYFTLGLLTKFMSLPAAAWAGRLICWTAIAVGWKCLCQSLIGRRFWSIPAAGLLLVTLRHCHLAGEWLIGGVEAKGLAYAFVFSGLGFLVRKKWKSVWWRLGLGSAFHVLVGGWAVIAAGMVWLVCRGWRSELREQLVSGVTGFLLALVGLIPALVLTAGQDPEIVRSANEIYTYERIAHHLVFSHIVETSPARLDFFLLALVLWAGLQWACWESSRYRVLGLFVTAAVMIGGLAILIESYAMNTERPDLAASLLRYYWFRLADVLVPAGVALGGVLAIRKFTLMESRWGPVLLAVVVCGMATDIACKQTASAIEKRAEADALTLPAYPEWPTPINRKIVRDWIDVCTWIRSRTPVDSRFLTPRAQSTFKWYAHRSEVVSWKDVPQDAAGIVNWRNRFEVVFGGTTFRQGLATLDAEDRLLELGKKFDARYLVIERRMVRERKNELEYRYRYQQFLLGRDPGSTPFVKPLCLRKVYPDSDSPREIQDESTYLVYELVIPEHYGRQMQELRTMLRWYQQLEMALERGSQPFSHDGEGDSAR